MEIGLVISLILGSMGEMYKGKFIGNKKFSGEMKRSKSSSSLVAFFSKLKSKADLMKGFILFKQGRMEATIKAIEKATEADPHNIFAWKFKGIVLSRYLHRYNEAIEALDRSLQIDPRDANVWGLKGIILARYLHKYEEAIDAFDRAILLDPSEIYVWDCRLKLSKLKV
jgi:tetratricopeptide (TPR) repeat protein